MRISILISLVCALTAFGRVQPEPGFDPKEVARRVCARGEMTLGAAGANLPGLGTRSELPDRNLVMSRAGRHRSRVPFNPTTAGSGGLFTDDGEFLLDTNSTLVPAPGEQFEPVVAFDGANFLVVWEDYRGARYSDIWGARVTPQGTVLDVSGFIISQGADDQVLPALGFDGTNFLVVWQDYRSTYHSDIYGARVTTGGAVLDPLGFVITEAGNGQYSPVVSFGGADFLVVWQDCRVDPERPDITGRRVTPGGVVLDPDTGFVIARSTGARGAPAIAFDGSNFLVAWQDARTVDFDIWGARVSPAGTMMGSLIIASGPGVHCLPSIGFDGENYLVVWQIGDLMHPADIWGARVTTAGHVLDGAGVVISAASSLQCFPAVAFGGTDFLVVWQDYRAGGYADIYGARMTPQATVLDTNGFVIPQAARDQLTPALGFDGENYLVVWEDHRSGGADIYGTRVTSGGGVLDPDGIAISQGLNWQRTPDVAFDGANYLVVWEDQRSGSCDIYGTRVTPGGIVLNTDGIVISQAPKEQHSPAIGFDGTNYLVVWSDYRSADYTDLFGARVTPGGTVLDLQGFAISQADMEQWHPAVGFDGTNYLVVWEDYRGDYADIYGARVTRQGAVLDPQGIAISPGVLDQLDPALAFDGSNFFVAWTDYRSGVYSDVFGARVTPQGAVLDPEGLGIWRSAKSQVGPALGLGFDGTHFLVVWEDYRSDHPDIYGALVTTAGVVYDSGWVVRQDGNQFFPVLARGAGSQMFLVYQGWVGMFGGKTYNTDRVWGKFNPLPGSIEETPSADVRTPNRVATVVRGVLFLPEATSLKPQATSLMDIGGRKVLDLKPGANDVRALAPGVYFVREAVSGERAAAGVRKVVVTR